MLLFVVAELLYDVSCGNSILTLFIHGQFPCCLDRVDSRALRRSEGLDLWPLDDVDETEPRRCSALISGVTFSILAQVISCFCRSLISSLLLLGVLLLLIISCSYNWDVAYRVSFHRVKFLCTLQYVLIDDVINLCNTLMKTPSRGDSSYTIPQCSAFRILLLGSVLQIFLPAAWNWLSLL